MGEVDDRLELERRRQSKLEEALEIKSLRRIISAYLNYPDAAENDIRRYERSFTKLPPAHKALLSHFPLKFENLRRCIRVNTYFIMSMLQAFDPPLDMNQDIDIDKGGNLEHHHECPCSDSVPNHEANLISRRSLFACGETPVSEAQAATSKTSSDFDQKCLEKNHSGERQEFFTGISQKILSGDESGNKELRQVMDNASLDGAKVISDRDRHDCGSVANGSVTCSPCDWLDPSLQVNVPLVDVDKVRCIVRNIVRDWAPEGQKERDQCYKPILEELDRLFPDRCKNWPPTCLVPGAGLGRLALEISCLGFVSQGNEFSYYMMICSSFILNHAETAGQWTIYPWIHSNCNSLSDNDQLRAVSFPDIHPASAGITEGFSMCGGDFVEVYNDKSQEASWDAVVTCFFLDTAHNIVEYIEIISKILKDGGVWINFGPLLYHFADSYGADDDMSIELSLEDVKKVVLHYGFEIEVEKIIQTTYTANPRSMMQNRYFAAFWSMKRKPRV